MGAKAHCLCISSSSRRYSPALISLGVQSSVQRERFIRVIWERWGKTPYTYRTPPQRCGAVCLSPQLCRRLPRHLSSQTRASCSDVGPSSGKHTCRWKEAQTQESRRKSTLWTKSSHVSTNKNIYKVDDLPVTLEITTHLITAECVQHLTLI